MVSEAWGYLVVRGLFCLRTIVSRDTTVLMWGMHCPTIHKYVFDEYSFSIILNLIDNNRSYVGLYEKCANKMHHLSEAHQN